MELCSSDRCFLHLLSTGFNSCLLATEQAVQVMLTMLTDYTCILQSTILVWQGGQVMTGAYHLHIAIQIAHSNWHHSKASQQSMFSAAGISTASCFLYPFEAAG